MRTVTLGVATQEEIKQSILTAFDGIYQGEFITFDSPALLFKIISGKRWDLIQEMTGAGPLSIRELARRLGRDVKAVHTDVHKLLKTGILEKTESGQIEFPYDEIHVDFVVKSVDAA